MPVLHIKDFPPDLSRALKAAAALEGKTLREFIIALLRVAAGNQGEAP